MTLFCVVFIFIAYHLLEALLALWFVGTKRFHRLGLRFMAMCVFTSWAVPHFCSYECDRSCGNWTCPNYFDSCGSSS